MDEVDKVGELSLLRIVLVWHLPHLLSFFPPTTIVTKEIDTNTEDVDDDLFNMPPIKKPSGTELSKIPVEETIALGPDPEGGLQFQTKLLVGEAKNLKRLLPKQVLSLALTEACQNTGRGMVSKTIHSVAKSSLTIEGLLVSVANRPKPQDSLWRGQAYTGCNGAGRRIV